MLERLDTKKPCATNFPIAAVLMRWRGGLLGFHVNGGVAVLVVPMAVKAVDGEIESLPDGLAVRNIGYPVQEGAHEFGEGDVAFNGSAGRKFEVL